MEMMTDYIDLIARLRLSQTGGIHYEAADALEAQAKRIAEIKAALKPFADKADKAEGPFEPPYPVDYPLWRAARAAYLGEKE